MMTRKLVGTLLLAGSLIALCLAGRLLPHAPNFTPVAATALFAAAMFRRRWVAALIPLLALLISDAVIGTYDWRIMTATYIVSLLPVLMGSWMSGRGRAVRIAGAAVLSAVLFFVGTNFAVWAFGGMYDRNLSGLIACYASALPFFQYTLYGNLLWCGVLFGGHALGQVLAPRWRDLLPRGVTATSWGYRQA